MNTQQQILGQTPAAAQIIQDAQQSSTTTAMLSYLGTCNLPQVSNIIPSYQDWLMRERYFTSFTVNTDNGVGLNVARLELNPIKSNNNWSSVCTDYNRWMKGDLSIRIVTALPQAVSGKLHIYYRPNTTTKDTFPSTSSMDTQPTLEWDLSASDKIEFSVPNLNPYCYREIKQQHGAYGVTIIGNDPRANIFQTSNSTISDDALFGHLWIFVATPIQVGSIFPSEYDFIVTMSINNGRCARPLLYQLPT